MSYGYNGIPPDYEGRKKKRRMPPPDPSEGPEMRRIRAANPQLDQEEQAPRVPGGKITSGFNVPQPKTFGDRARQAEMDQARQDDLDREYQIDQDAKKAFGEAALRDRVERLGRR